MTFRGSGSSSTATARTAPSPSQVTPRPLADGLPRWAASLRKSTAACARLSSPGRVTQSERACGGVWLAGRRFSLVYFINQTYEGCNAGDRAYVEKVRARTNPQPHAILPSFPFRTPTNRWLPEPQRWGSRLAKRRGWSILSGCECGCGCAGVQVPVAGGGPGQGNLRVGPQAPRKRYPHPAQPSPSALPSCQGAAVPSTGSV